MWSDIFGVLGGMVMSNNMLGISWYDFLNRFQQSIPVRSLIIGIAKAPVFALIIASIGCFQGMQVKNSAESVGQNTTRSVVLAIFFIIVADAAIFSIIFSKMKLHESKDEDILIEIKDLKTKLGGTAWYIRALICL